MADDGIKKATLIKASLPPLNGTTQSYILRYRIVTEDKNRTSHWSPRYTLISGSIPTIDPSQKSIVVAGTGSTRTITAVWVPPASLGINNFDIYVKTNLGQYVYKTTVSTTTYATIASVGDQIGIAVQVPTYPKKRFTSATLFEEITTIV